MDTDRRALWLPGYLLLLLLVAISVIVQTTIQTEARRLQKHHHRHRSEDEGARKGCDGGNSNSSRLESEDPSKLRVIGGRQALPGEFPFTVRITKDGETICTGSIFDDRFILTAAHCVVELTSTGKYQPVATNRLVVVAGDYNSEWYGDNQREFQVSEVMAHYEFKSYGAYTINDIAMLRTSTYIPFGKLPEWQPGQGTAIERIELPGRGELDQARSGTFEFAGWGAVVYYQETGQMIFPNYLFTYDTKLATCSHYSVPDSISAVSLCTSSVEKGNCVRDSGGPLFMRWREAGDRSGPQYKQFGIATFRPFGCVGSLSYYLDLSQYVPWITDVLVNPKALALQGGRANVTREEEAFDDDDGDEDDDEDDGDDDDDGQARGSSVHARTRI